MIPNENGMNAPELTVVVGLISGKKDDLGRCLAALACQENPPSFEVVVPYDDPCADVRSLAAEHTAVRFIRAEGLDTAAARRGASREHHDSLRTIGLKNARGRIVALTEDHAVASPTWCADMVWLLDERPRAAAVGGAVDCRNDSIFSWAVYWCDFGRYQSPLREGPAPFVSDSNVAYRKDALEAIRSSWENDYHETIVHDALTRAGRELLLTPKSRVWQARGRLPILKSLVERFVWARSYAGTRVAAAPLARRLFLAAASFVLPLVLTWRIAKGVLERRILDRRFVLALPAIFLLQGFWAFGEFVGYVTKNPGKA